MYMYNTFFLYRPWHHSYFIVAMSRLHLTYFLFRESFNSVKKVVHDVAMDVHSDDSSCSLSGEGVVYTKHNLEVKTSNPRKVIESK